MFSRTKETRVCITYACANQKIDEISKLGWKITWFEIGVYSFESNKFSSRHSAALIISLMLVWSGVGVQGKFMATYFITHWDISYMKVMKNIINEG